MSEARPNWWERGGGHHRGSSIADAKREFLAAEDPPHVFMGGPRQKESERHCDDLVKILRKYRFDPEYAHEPKRVPLTCLSLYSGIPVRMLEYALKTGRLSRYQIPKLTWIVNRFEDGEIVCRRWHKRWYVCLAKPSDQVSYELRERIERCPCGRYERCPCGQLPIHKANKNENAKNLRKDEK